MRFRWFCGPRSKREMRTLKRLFGGGGSANIDRELQFHIDERTDYYVASGVRRSEALRSGARRVWWPSADQGAGPRGMDPQVVGGRTTGHGVCSAYLRPRCVEADHFCSWSPFLHQKRGRRESRSPEGNTDTAAPTVWQFRDYQSALELRSRRKPRQLTRGEERGGGP
jgi:hypothetical protein